jgi:glycosyltransferase 2 family protein
MSETAPSQASPASRWQQILPRLAFSLLLAGGFVWLFHKGGLPLLPPAAARAEIRWWCVPAGVAVITLSSLLRTYRWVYLLRAIRPVGTRRTVGINFLGYGAICLAPLRSGELVRPWLISQRDGVTFAQATGTVAAERIVDGLIVTALLFVGLLAATPLSPLPSHVGQLALPVAQIPRAAYAALGVFACAFVAMGLFYWAREVARKLVFSTIGLVSTPLATFLSEKVERIAQGLAFLPSREFGLPFFRDTLLYWACNVAFHWVLLRGCGIEASFAESCVILGVLGLGILVPAGPGFFGAFQFSAYCGLAMFIPADRVLVNGAAFVFVAYAFQLGTNVLGIPIGALLVRGTKGAVETETAAAGEPAEA